MLQSNLVFPFTVLSVVFYSMCLNTICRFHYHALLFVLKPFVKVLKLGLFLVFPPLDMPLCDEVYVAEIPSLRFVSSPSRTSLQSVLVVESALLRAIQVNNRNEVPIPSNKFQTGIPFLSILQEGLESLKQLYKNFRLTTLSKALPPSHLSTPLLFIYPALPSGSSVRPPASPSGSSSEPCPYFASSEV